MTVLQPKTLSLVVNNKPVSLPTIPGETLAELLRERLKLTGTKIGCNEAECGACTVLVNGEPVLSCAYPAVRAEGKEVLTIEGLAKHQVDRSSELLLHPLQQAFIDYGAVQCGFCTPGQIMTAYALLLRDPHPTLEEMRLALSGTLCRCGGYPAIQRAVLAGAEAMRTGNPVLAPTPDLFTEESYQVGRVIARPDATQKVTGEAIYTDDLSFSGMLIARVKRAGIPHAILRGLDVHLAQALPGVHKVLTAKDLPAGKKHGLVRNDWPILVGEGERIRYVGDALAIIAADSYEIATQALELIKVDLEPQPVVAGAQEALQPSAPRLHEGGNLLKHIQVRKGDVRIGFDEADKVVEHTFWMPSAEHMFLEPECSLARLTP